jgi:hypothetical protein
MHTVTQNKFMFRLRASAAALVSISIAIFFYVAQSGAFRKTLFLSPFFVQAHANVIAGLPYNPYASMPECLLSDVCLVSSDICRVSCV